MTACILSVYVFICGPSFLKESVAVSNVHDFARVEASTSTEKTSESLRVVEQAVKVIPQYNIKQLNVT